MEHNIGCDTMVGVSQKPNEEGRWVASLYPEAESIGVLEPTKKNKDIIVELGELNGKTVPYKVYYPAEKYRRGEVHDLSRRVLNRTNKEGCALCKRFDAKTKKPKENKPAAVGEFIERLNEIGPRSPPSLADRLPDLKANREPPMEQPQIMNPFGGTSRTKPPIMEVADTRPKPIRGVVQRVRGDRKPLFDRIENINKRTGGKLFS